MKKTFLVLTMLCLLVFSSAAGPQEKADQKSDPLLNFSLVSETKPVSEDVKVGFESITGRDAVTYLKFLSDDLLEGRDTGLRGYDIAALYGATMFELWGIKPAGDVLRPRMDFRRMMMGGGPPADARVKRGYLQNIAFREILGSTGMSVVKWQKGSLTKTRTFHPDMDYAFRASEAQSLTAPVVFVGYGIQEPSLKFDEYKDLDVKGKFVMMLSEAPGKGDPDSPFNKGELKKKYYPQRNMMRRRMTDPKLKTAQDLGAIGVLMVENSPDENSDVARRTLDGRKINDERPIFPGPRRRVSLIGAEGPSFMRGAVPTLTVSREMADAILGMVGQEVDDLKTKIGKTRKSHSMTLSGVSLTVKHEVESKLINSMNVLGYIEGSDPELKKEAIVIGGHLDHLGKRGDYIFNGADDDGSGSVGVMEIAQAFAMNPVKPKRSIIFALWTGEEKGLLGSRYYVAHPFMKTYCNLNLDMISRVYTKDRLAMMARRFGAEVSKEALDKIDAGKYVTLSYDAKTPMIGEFMRKNNEHVGLHMSLTASEEASGGSDHAPFAMSGIPWAFMIAAMTEDYHQPSDTVEKVSAKLMEKIIRITYLTAFDLANN